MCATRMHTELAVTRNERKCRRPAQVLVERVLAQKVEALPKEQVGQGVFLMGTLPQVALLQSMVGEHQGMVSLRIEGGRQAMQAAEMARRMLEMETLRDDQTRKEDLMVGVSQAPSGVERVNKT